MNSHQNPLFVEQQERDEESQVLWNEITDELGLIDESKLLLCKSLFEPLTRDSETAGEISNEVVNTSTSNTVFPTEQNEQQNSVAQELFSINEQDNGLSLSTILDFYVAENNFLKTQIAQFPAVLGNKTKEAYEAGFSKGKQESSEPITYSVVSITDQNTKVEKTLKDQLQEAYEQGFNKAVEFLQTHQRVPKQIDHSKVLSKAPPNSVVFPKSTSSTPTTVRPKRTQRPPAKFGDLSYLPNTGDPANSAKKRR